MKTIFDKQPELTEETKQLLASAVVEVLGGDVIIWKGVITELPQDVVTQIWRLNP